MASWTEQALIGAPVEEVWELLSDPSRAPDWDEEVLEVTGPPVKIEKGSTFGMTARGPMGMKSSTTFKVEELEEMRELRMQCQRSGFYVHWVLTPARDDTFAELELGVKPIGGLASGATGVLHTKGYLRRTVHRTLDGLKRAIGRAPTERSGR